MNVRCIYGPARRAANGGPLVGPATNPFGWSARFDAGYSPKINKAHPQNAEFIKQLTGTAAKAAVPVLASFLFLW